MQLHDYQEVGVKHLISNRYAGLLWAPGLGKTLTTLAAFRKARELKRVPVDLPMLIIAPLSVAKSVWQDEVRKWYPDMAAVLLHGPEKAARVKQKADIFIINPEGLKWLWALVDSGEIEFAGVTFDELTKFKATNTQRFKETRKRLPKFRFRWGLTGTPAPNSMMELFGQTFVLDNGERFGKFIGKFRNKYFTPAGPYEWVLRKGGADAIRAKLSDIMLHLDAADYLDIPKRKDNHIYVRLPTHVMETYKQLERDMYLELGGSEISAVHGGALVQKLQQITQGFMYDDEKSVVSLHDEKLDRLEELFEEMSGQPLFVVYKFKEDLRRLRERFPFAVDLRGDVQSIVSQWNSGDLPMVLAQPQSAGHGLNMQAGGHTICHYTMNHSLEQYIQVNGRVDRQGQTMPVTVHHLIASGTIDGDIMQVLANRDSSQKALLAGLRRRIENG